MDNILIVLAVAGIVFAFEKVWPNAKLNRVQHWYGRAIVFNSAQAIIAFSGSYLWDKWFAQYHLISLDTQSLYIQVLVGYLSITFIYYWWHRLRHSNSFLWRNFHQLHHSPVRLEVITSFYKHPGEMLANGLLTSAILYVFLGLTSQAVVLCVLATGLAELVYHMNIKTPRIMGFFFQRPEMHRIHHRRGVHHYNYSDLPVWDMLFGTYRNPAVVENETGFPDNGENRVWALLKGTEIQS